MKMALNATIIPFAQSNLFFLIDVETLLGLNAMMPLLKVVRFLIKFAQLKDFLSMIS
jgi:type IV secretory pathway component VirB8